MDFTKLSCPSSLAPMELRRALGVLLAVVCVGLLCARRTQASPLFELAGASSGTGGYNARVTGPGAASTYFNPALLSSSEGELVLGIVVMSEQIGMTLDGRTSGNVPLIVGERGILDPNGNPISNATVPTDWLEQGCPVAECGSPPFAARPRQAAGSSGVTRAYTVIGLTDRLLEDRLVLGLYALVPMGDFTSARSFYNDEREQFFSNSLHPEMYGDRQTATSLAFGAGSRLFGPLSVGIGFTLSLTNTAESSTYVRDSIDYDKLLVSNDVHVKAGVAPHFGLAYEVLDWLHLSATVHTPQKFKLDMGIAAALPAGNESQTTRSETHNYLPWSFGLGAAVDLNPDSPHVFSIVGSAKYALWSAYVDRHGESPGAQGSEYDFKDVLSETLGVHHHVGSIETFLDATYQPTPVPPQTGRSNYIDNDRVGAILGGAFRFSVAALELKVSLQGQAQRLIPRYQAKNDALIVDELPDDSVDNRGMAIPGAAGLQTNNPGWPGFRSEGWIFGAATTIALIY